MKEDILKIDAAKKSEELVAAIRKVFKDKGFSRAVLGVSGGLDSATVSFLLARALGRENVTGIILPYAAQSTAHSEEVVAAAGISSETMNIAPMVDAYFSMQPEADKVRRGNKMARERMTILYDRSHALGALVAGTGNRTEIELGYFTLHGDGASAVAPLASLYKTQVFQLAKYLKVPESVLGKSPSADLWEGQTDEGEIGATYAEMDEILYHLDKGRTAGEIVKLGFEKKSVEIVIARKKANRYKLEGAVFL